MTDKAITSHLTYLRATEHDLGADHVIAVALAEIDARSEP